MVSSLLSILHYFNFDCLYWTALDGHLMHLHYPLTAGLIII